MEQRSPYWQRRARCPRSIVIAFYRELSTLLKAGLPIINALQVTVDHSADDTMAVVAADLQAKLDAGQPMSVAMSSFPRIFEPVPIGLIRLGETTGQLIAQLEQISVWMDRDEKLRRRVVAALIYPTFALTITAVLTLVLFVTVVPGFIQMFQEMKVALPFPTRVLVAVTHLLTSPVTWAAASFFVLVLSMVSKRFLNSPSHRLLLFRLGLAVPVLGPLLQYTGVARFAFAAAPMLRSGGNVVAGFRLSAEASGSPAITADAEPLAKALQDGRMLSEHLAKHPEIYPTIAVQLVAVGEESARLPEMFRVMADFFEEVIEHQIHLLTSLLEPLLMAIVSIVVGFVVMGVFLPMYGFVFQVL
jgi:type IV pilus assembly protein PilC